MCVYIYIYIYIYTYYVRDRTESAEPNRTGPSHAASDKTQAEPRRAGENRFPNRTDDFLKHPEPKRTEP